MEYNMNIGFKLGLQIHIQQLTPKQQTYEKWE